ncbi:hypothetical protein HYU18_01125 [Candidatus Woesearchaeota archaeon]|nr:hypothetical protein [Candidatus Woesearchaeota archaeon]
MASILDLGLLKGFSDIFVWILVFIIVYGALEVTNLLKNRGLHALFAFVVTAVIVLTGGGTNIIAAMAPWVVVIAAFMFFLLLLGQFAGLEQKQIVSVFGTGWTWVLAIPLLIILIVAWTQGPESEVVVDPVTGEEIAVDTPREQRPFLGILTDPKVLGLILIMAIGAMTLTMMARGGPAGGH